MRKLALLATLLTTPLAAQSSLCPQLKSLVADSPAHWGISLTTLDGTPLCALNDSQLFRPASNNKLFTTAAALALLGPDKTFETKVTGNFDPKTGVVKGDLTLVGGGDANLDSGDLPYQPHPTATPPPFAFHDLEDLADQLVAKGVKTVTGDIVGDDTLFPYEPYPTAWELDDLVYGFGAPISALTIADNQLKLTITASTTPGKTGKVDLDLDQHGIPFYSIRTEVEARASDEEQGVQVERNPGSKTLRIDGFKALNTTPETEEVSIDDPALYAAMALRNILKAHGINVRGTVRAAHSKSGNGVGFLTRLHGPLDRENAILNHQSLMVDCLVRPEDPTLAVRHSAPLAQDVLYTNKTSQNLHAELILHSLGAADPCWSGSTIAGARMIRAFLLHAGIAPDDFVLYDGSGLSSHDLVTPRSLTQLLVYAAKQPWFESFKSALPIGGVDGSLRSRFSDQDAPALKGRVFAKTGTLGESRALSGYLTADSGQTLVFSILVDNHPPNTTTDRTLTDHLLELIAAAN